MIGLLLACFTHSSSAICSSIDSLDWLNHRWVSEGKNKTSVERWEKVSPLSLEGAGETFDVSTGERVFSESLRILEMSGEIFYLAKVKDNPLPVAFRLIECSPNKAVFENQAHDFPQRLEYRIVADSTLRVNVSGSGGRSFEQNFTLQDE